MIIKAISYFATAFFTNDIPRFSSLLSFPCFLPLSHPRNALRLPEDDGNASTISAKLSVIPLLSFPCLTRESKKYKARPYDMHAESNALQQRFAPQPLMRSSWLQLARFNKGSRRSLRALKGVPLSSWQQLVSRRGRRSECQRI